MTRPVDAIPSEIGKYRVTGILGQGGMAQVYRAEDPHIGRPVAIKVMSEGTADDARFLREARIIGGFSHPNIVVLHDFGFHEGRPHLVMELAPGESLEAWLKRRHPLAEHLRIIEGLCSALQYAHQRGILHRDLKPSNLQITPDGQCKLMDFGIARDEGARVNGNLTGTGVVMGTPSYLPPEILADAQYSMRGDVYSAALVFYEMLAGANPFAAKGLAATLNNILNVRPTDLSALRPDLPPELTREIMACLARDPNLRPADLSALLDVVARMRATLTPARPLASLPATQYLFDVPLIVSRWRHRTMTLRLAAAAVGVAALAASSWLLWRARLPGTVAPPAAVVRVTAPVASPMLPPAALPVPEPPAAAATAPAETVRRQPARATARRARPSEGSQPPTVEIVSQPSDPAEPPAVPPPAVHSPPPQAGPELLRADPALDAGRRPPSPSDPVVTLTSVAPRTLQRRSTLALLLSGTGFRADHRAEVLLGRQPAEGIRITRQDFISATLIRLTVVADDGLPLGMYWIVLRDRNGYSSNSLGLEVVL